MNDKAKNNNNENLSERLEKIIEQKSNENAALNNLLKKIYEDLEEMHTDNDEKSNDL